MQDTQSFYLSKDNLRTPLAVIWDKDLNVKLLWKINSDKSVDRPLPDRQHSHLFHFPHNLLCHWLTLLLPYQLAASGWAFRPVCLLNTAGIVLQKVISGILWSSDWGYFSQVDAGNRMLCFIICQLSCSPQSQCRPLKGILACNILYSSFRAQRPQICTCVSVMGNVRDPFKMTHIYAFTAGQGMDPRSQSNFTLSWHCPDSLNC